MAKQLDLSEEDTALISELIDSLIMKLVLSWDLSFESTSGMPNASRLQIDATSRAVYGHEFRLANEKHSGTPESVNSDISAEFNMASNAKPLGPSDGSFELNMDDQSSDFLLQDDDMSEHDLSTKESEFSSSGSACGMSRNSSLSGVFSLSLADQELNDELKLEIVAIDSQYNHCFQELLRLREEAIENIKKRWMMKKKISVM